LGHGVQKNSQVTSVLPMHILIFTYAAPFLNESASKATGIENRGKIVHILPPPPL